MANRGNQAPDNSPGRTPSKADCRWSAENGRTELATGSMGRRSLKNMTPFQYVAPLTSIVIALGITRILTGLGRTFQMRGSIRTYWVYTLWTGNVFLWLLVNLSVLYRGRNDDSW